MKDCNCNKPVCAGIRKDIKPSCPPQAIIPAITVQSVDDLKTLSDCFVKVSDTNTVYYIDDKQRIISTWTGIATVSNYDPTANPLKLRDQIAFDTASNTLYFFNAQAQAYIPKTANVAFDEILDRPKYAGEEMTSETSIPDVDAAITAEKEAREQADSLLGEDLVEVRGMATSAIQPDDINIDVMTNLEVDSNISTTIVKLNGSKQNLKTGATSSIDIPLPVASSTQAGVMNSAFYSAAQEATESLDALLNGAVAITGISASPSQSDLTTAWETATGLSTLMNRASIFDVDNNKVWTYYTNDATWHAAANTSSVSVSQFTNSSLGTIKGSTGVGQIFAENDGTGSVNGWDTLSATVANHTSDISALQQALTDAFYPVGSIYMSATLTTEAAVGVALGGTWVRWGEGRVPVGVGSNGSHTYTTAETNGGADSRTLSSNNLPSHSHTYNEATAVSGTTLQEKHLPVIRSYVSGVAVYNASDTNQASFPFKLRKEGGTWRDGTTGTIRDWGTIQFNLGNGSSHTHALTTESSYTGSAGSSSPTGVDVRQSYITCYMYKRIA